MADSIPVKPIVKLQAILDEAQFEFWLKVAEHMPLITSGDFDPISSSMFDYAIEEAITTWWNWNASTLYALQLPSGEILQEEQEVE